MFTAEFGALVSSLGKLFDAAVVEGFMLFICSTLHSNHHLVVVLIFLPPRKSFSTDENQTALNPDCMLGEAANPSFRRVSIVRAAV